MSAYREGFGQVEQRRAEVALVRARVASSEPDITRVIGARIGRLVGGLVGLSGLVLLVPVSLVLPELVGSSSLVSVWFFGTVVAALLSAFVFQRAHSVIHRIRRRRAQREAPREASELLRAHDLPAIEAQNPWPRLGSRLANLEAPSLVVPLVFASFVMPLLVHALVYFPIAAASGKTNLLDGFSAWIMISAIVVGHAHAALAICAGRYGSKIARTTTAELVDEARLREASGTVRDWAKALWIAVGVASVPGIVLLAVPTVLAIVTGLAVIPLMYSVAKRTLLRERQLTDGVTHEVERIRVGLEDVEAARGELVRIATTETEHEVDPDAELSEPDAVNSDRRLRRGAV